MERGGIYNILKIGWIYDLWQFLAGSSYFKRRFVHECLKPGPGDKILDFGCGTGEIVKFLPETVEYYGLDLNQDCINRAQKINKRGTFFQMSIDNDCCPVIPPGIPDCNIVLSMALFHHLNDNEAEIMLKTAKTLLASRGGRFVVLDNCLTEPQNPLARWLIKHDRGKFARPFDWYKSRLCAGFTKCDLSVHTDMLRYPYSLIFADCQL
jgi:SAM-dependent methyltransferase